MPQPVVRRQKRRRSPLVLFLFILLWSVILGVGLAQATESSAMQTPARITSEINLAQSIAPEPDPDPNGTVDWVAPRYQLGEQIYLENCTSCHVGLPPQIFPTETWRDVLEDSQHYGVQLTPLVDPPRLLVWNYLRTFSRPLTQGEAIPYRIGDSRYFKALHPKVDIPRPVNVDSCAACHPGARQYNFRSLTPQWQSAP